MQKPARRRAPRHARPSHRGRNAAFAVTGALALGGAGLLGLPAVTGAHAATTPTVTQDKLTPATMVAGKAATASLTVHSSACFTTKTVGVGVRDAAGHNLDFPGSVANAQICPSGLSVTTGSRTLPAGTYTQFGFWQDLGGAWHNLPSQQLVVSAATAAPSPAPTATPTPSATATATPSSPAAAAPVAGKKLTWSDEFDSLALGSRWTADRSSSYHYGDHNPDDNKLDWLNKDNVAVSGGVATFTARPSAHTLENGKKAWDTGLLTTEYSTEGFKVQTGDYIETRVKLPAGTGAWPALWTWNGTSGNHGEIDSFEYHADNANLLELTNHINPGYKYVTDAKSIAHDQWVTVGTQYGATSVDWYINGVKVFSDGKGVGAGWSAYPILNLSLSAGQYHPAPTGTAPITFAADYLRVYR
ncbi:family 16 glycosylhydrolase [Kitasatospora sp. A2-31]|uniref:glycoside hydrolase family 16 protein n=1 Tax=Kitasatospora sp. A2-31 TaxID=2916414 RepID=UPI001EEA0E67|nr:glycoside hydrolase family 16 protein [Kitasatospora sp. A2-31]MCG6496030.1 glycoside hydrolase family 16 protein [Kitasatospora sp. A2-31]